MSGPSEAPGFGQAESPQSPEFISAPSNDFDDTVALASSNQSTGSAPSSDDALNFSGPAGAAAAPSGNLPAGNPPSGNVAGSPVGQNVAGKTATKPTFEARKVRLSIKRFDPWSVMKLSFLLSIAAGIMLVVATVVVWNMLDSMYVFAQVDELVVSIVGPESEFTVLNYVAYDMVTSYAVIIAVVNVVLITALATIGAFLYNLTAMLIGGLNVTLTDE